jgi:hypothetical protein
MFELAISVLIVTAYPDVSDPLPLADHKVPFLSGNVGFLRLRSP